MKLINEKDVEIDVKNEGILEVPEGKTVDQLPMSHFEKLAKKNGLGKITKALNNLQVWNKNDDPKLSKWAGNMIDKLNKKLKKDEAVSKRGRKRSTGKSNSVASFLDRQIESGKIDEKQITVVYDKNNNIMWLGKAGFYPLLMSNVEYRSSGYDKDHPHEFWINARSYTQPFEENLSVKDVKKLTIDEESMGMLDDIAKMQKNRSSRTEYEQKEDDKKIKDYVKRINDKLSKKESLLRENDDYWWSLIPSYLIDVVKEMERLGWEGVGYTTTGVDYCISATDNNRPELDYEMCVSIYEYDDAISLSKYVDIYDWDKEKEVSRVPNSSGVSKMRTVDDVRKFTNWFNALANGSNRGSNVRLNRESIGYDRYDPNVEARFMDIGDTYNDMPDLYDLYAANKGLPVSEFIKDARNGGFSKAEIDAFIRDNGITGKMCEGCGKKKKKGTRKLKEGSNFDNVTDAIDYYYGKWLYDDISYNGIADELAGLGHSERFIDAVLDGITQLYDDQERYDYEHDYYDESVNRFIEFGVDEDEDYEYKEFDIEERYGYLIYSTMTDNTFFVMAYDEYDAKKYGEWLAEIYRSDTDDQDVLLSEFYDSVPPSVYVTDPEQDDCEFDRTTNQWIVSIDGGYGGQFSIVLVGSYKGRF